MIIMNIRVKYYNFKIKLDGIMKFIPSFSIYICVNDKYNMKELTNKELDFVTKCPVILNEIVERPIRKRFRSKFERLNEGFADVSTSLNCYSVTNDNKLREIHTIVNSFKDETPTVIKEVVKSYYPKISKHDISLIVDNALTI